MLMLKEKKQEYVSLSIEMLEARVEKGFGQSSGGHGRNEKKNEKGKKKDSHGGLWVTIINNLSDMI